MQKILALFFVIIKIPIIKQQKTRHKMYMEIKMLSASASISIYSNNEMRLDYLESKTPRNGHGTQMLKHICAMADGLKMSVSLLPVSNSGMSARQLRAFYARFGFEDYESGMIRHPKV